MIVIECEAQTVEDDLTSAYLAYLTCADSQSNQANQAALADQSETVSVVTQIQTEYEYAEYVSYIEEIQSEEDAVLDESIDEASTINSTLPTGPHITPESGVFNGPSGFETYYNLDMSGCIYYMRLLGYSEADYPYWVREDGAKMFGPYIMVAANLNIRPKGTIVACSLGTAIVVDTGGFAYSNPTQLDIAVAW